MKGQLLYVPPEMIREIERIRNQLGISKADAMRIILKGGGKISNEFII